jgi:glycosyltransferase involved in cell wall biosynthesis
VEKGQELKDKLRIAIVVSHPIQHFCPQYASWAANKGIQLKVFFGSDLGAVKYFDPNFKKEINWNQLYLEEYEHDFLNGDKTLQPDKKLEAPNLDQRLTDFNPSLVVYYGYFQKLSRQAKNWARKHGIKTAYISDAEFRQKRPFWKQFIKFPFLYFFFKNTDYFLTVGDANETYYRFYGVPRYKMRRMHFPIDIINYQTAFENKTALRNHFRITHHIDENTCTLAVAGKLVSWKSQDHLIALMKKLEEDYPQQHFHLLIAGSGPMEKKWKEFASGLCTNEVSFLGFVSPEELPAVYAAADIYIHPAKAEPHSLSVSEAIYMGCPVIVADTTGSWGSDDDVQPGLNGFIYPWGNLNALAEAIKKIVAQNLFQKMGKWSEKISHEYQEQSHHGILEMLDK